MPINIPKKPRDKFEGVNDTAVSFGEPQVSRHIQADPLDATAELNGGQPPAEEAPVNFRGDPVSAEQAKPEPGLEPGTLQADDFLAAGGLGKLAADLLGQGAKKVAEKLLPRVGAEGVTALREAQAAVKAGKMAPEGLADLARRLLGKETPVVATTSAREASGAAVGRANQSKMDQAWWDTGKVTEGVGRAMPKDFAGGARNKGPALAQDAVKWPGPATNAGARVGGQVPMTKAPIPAQPSIADQFHAAGQDWLTNEFPQIVTQSMKPGVR